MLFSVFFVQNGIKAIKVMILCEAYICAKSRVKHRKLGITRTRGQSPCDKNIILTMVTVTAVTM